MNNVLLIFSAMPEYTDLYLIPDVSDSELEQMKAINGKYINGGENHQYLDLLNNYLIYSKYIKETQSEFDNKDWFDDLKEIGFTRDDIGKFDKFKVGKDEILQIQNLSNLTVIQTGMYL